MNTQNLGIVSPVAMGDWQENFQYQKLNIVRHNGSSYIAKSENSGIEPGVESGWSAYWMLLNTDVEGAQGPQGPAGEGVPTGGLTGQILSKNSNTNYDTEWIPQSQINAGSAVKDGQGNNIPETYETKQHASQTYETKLDAATKNSNLQIQITQNQNRIYSNTEQISEIQNSVSQNSALISRNSKRLDGLEQRINPSPFVTDSAVAYQKDVPQNAVGAVEIQKIGGMTYKTTNLIKTPYVDISKTENGITWTVNSDGSVRASGTSTAGSTFVLCNSVSFGSSDVNALTSNVTSGPYAFGNCAYNGTTQAVYLSVGVGETVSKTFYPIINIGASVAPYEPYYEGLRSAKVTEVKSVGANLWDEQWEVGQLDINTGNPASGTTRIRSKNYIPLDGEVEYHFSYDNNSNVFCCYDANYTFIGVKYQWDKKFTTLTNTKYVKFMLYPDYGTTYKNDIMLNKGSTALPYEPYVEHTLPIPAEVQALDGYGLGVNENLYNYLEWQPEDNVKTWNRKVEKITFTGTENWILYSNNIWTNILDKVAKDLSPCVYSGQYKIEIFNNAMKLKVFTEGAFTVDTWKAYLAEQYAAGTPVSVVYALANPEVTDISDLITSDNLLSIQGGGTLTFENEYGYDVPSTVEYITAEATA